MCGVPLTCKALPMHMSPTTGRLLPIGKPLKNTSACLPSHAGTVGTKSCTSGCLLACTGASSQNGRHARSTADPRRLSSPVLVQAAPWSPKLSKSEAPVCWQRRALQWRLPVASGTRARQRSMPFIRIGCTTVYAHVCNAVMWSPAVSYTLTFNDRAFASINYTTLR